MVTRLDNVISIIENMTELNFIYLMVGSSEFVKNTWIMKVIVVIITWYLAGFEIFICFFEILTC